MAFIGIHKKIINWEWYRDRKTTPKTLFLHCLIMANWKDGDWHGIPIKRGQFITSFGSLSQQLGGTKKTLRTSLNSLKKTHEVAVETTRQYTIITVCNYDKYQNQENKKGTEVGTEVGTKRTHNTEKKHEKRATTNTINTKQDLKTIINKEEEKKEESAFDSKENASLINLESKDNDLTLLNSQGASSNSNLPETNYNFDFMRFWSAYPRQVGQNEAIRFWTETLKPDEELIKKILSALEWQRETQEWSEKTYIPYPKNYLEGRRWEDNPNAYTKKDTKNVKSRPGSYREKESLEKYALLEAKDIPY